MIFGESDGVAIADITDGTSNTVSFVSAREPSPWTKPEEFTFDPARPLAVLSEADPAWSLVGMADASAMFAPLGDPERFRSMASRNGGRWSPCRTSLPGPGPSSGRTPTLRG